MNDIIKNHKAALEDYNKKIADIDVKRQKIEARIERANLQLGKLDKLERDLYKPSRYDIVSALAKKLSVHYGLPYEIYGPFGLECETSIYLREDMSKSICDQKTISIRLRLFGDYENDWLTYDTGERTNRYAKGSIGELNGYNSVYAPLPKDFNEILKLMRTSGPEKEAIKKTSLDDVIDACEKTKENNTTHTIKKVLENER